MPSRNLLVAQGGGPTAVINNSLLGIIEEASKKREISGIYGALHGINGVLKEEIVDLKSQEEKILKGLRHTPGAALGSCRRKLTEKDYDRILDVLKAHNIGFFLYIGGNDSMETADKINKLAGDAGYSLSVIGVPKTVDNDLAYTDHCPGYGSAARYTAISTLELGIDNESLPTPITIIETMGRNTGWLVASTSLAKKRPDDAPHLIYFPEIKFSEEKFLSDVEAVYERLGRVVIAVSEGIKDESGEYLGASRREVTRDGFGHKLPGGASAYLADLISAKLNLRCRFEKPGLLARASICHVSKVDREEAYRIGKAAVRQALQEGGYMMTLEREEGEQYSCRIGTVELSKVANVEKPLPHDFINSNGNHVTEKFIKYASPLIGGPLPEYVHLKKTLIKKNLPNAEH